MFLIFVYKKKLKIMSCYYIYKGKQYQELDDLYPVLLGEMEAEVGVVKVENGKETTVKINTELFPDKRDVVLKVQNRFTVKPIQAIDKKAVIKASIATQYIGFGEGIAGSSTESYRQQAGKFANTGNYSSDDIIFVSIGGKRGNEQVRKEQQDKTISEALKAIETGATLITENKSYVESSTYNEGEKRLAKNLEAKGYIYSEQTIDGQLLGIWNKQQVNSKSINEVKPGVEEVFQEKPELASIGTQEQYSQYLDTIFPDSKVKDIVYHGTDFDFLKSGEATWDSIGGFHFGTLKAAQDRINDRLEQTRADEELGFAPKEGVSLYGNGHIYAAILNATALDGTVDQGHAQNWAKYINEIKEGNWDSIEYINNQEDKGSNSYVVFEPEQIHILGSKQDIEGFKAFVNSSSIDVYKNSLKDKGNSLSLPTEEDLGLNTDLSQDDFKC